MSGGRSCRSPRVRTSCFRTVACVASMTTCWSAAVSCAVTSRSWRLRRKWPGELAPDRQSGHGINAGTGVRCQVARFGGRPSDLPYALLGRRAQRRYAVLPAGAPSPMPAPRILGNTGPMGDDSGRRGRAIRLTDRLGERGVLDQLIDAVRAGGSGVLVVRGEPGVGKSVLLDYLAGRASGCRPATRAMCCCLSCWRCSLVISGLPSRLYGAYQREWVFSSLTPTMIFAVYALAALLVVGRLSDSIGRKPESARRRKASRAGRMPVPRGRIQGRSGGLHGPVTATTMRAWSLPCSWSRQLLLSGGWSGIRGGGPSRRWSSGWCSWRCCW